MSKTLSKDGMSGLAFIDENVFHIEKSPLYTQLGNNVKTVEFIRSINKDLLFVEAKSSFPNPDGTIPNPKKGNKIGTELFDEEIADICEKFTHSLNLYSAIKVGVIGNGFPPDLYHLTVFPLCSYWLSITIRWLGAEELRKQ